MAVARRGLTESRARAQALIMGGSVSVDGQVVSRPGAMVGSDSEIELTSEPNPYVSRGGLKLKAALDAFEINSAEKTCADIGASTGGFTDVLLRGGARCVYAIDVGYGQLAWTLRNDPRVAVMERTNIRDVSELPDAIDLVVVDVSFISLKLVLPIIRRFIAPDGYAVVLIKPQFEAGRGEVGKKGVVRDAAVWRRVLNTVLTEAIEDGWHIRGLMRSPIRGPAGNVEFLANLSVGPGRELDLDGMIARVTDEVAAQ